MSTTTRFRWRSFTNRIPGVEVWQIGNEGGFLAAPVNLTANHGNRLLLALAERADLIVDFTHVRAKFETPGQFVWHCHIVEHEDNEMMRPYRIGPVQPGQPE